MPTYSVCLLYPDYLADPYGETWFDSVAAVNVQQAIHTARLGCCRDNGWTIGPDGDDEIQPEQLDDFVVVLVIQGKHNDIKHKGQQP